MQKRVLLTSAALALVLSGGQAYGQTRPTAATASVDELVVTATRREERLIDVPYNISAVAGAQIEANQVQNAAELLRSVPGVAVVDRGPRNQGVASSIQMRGLNVDSVILGDYAVSAVAPVSTYVNETPLFANFALVDLERVEVLRGPQGTLYGSGSLGGTVRYIVNAPRPGETGGRFGATARHTAGSEGVGFSGEAVLNVPVGDRAAFRFSASLTDLPGIVDYVNVYRLDAQGMPVAPAGVLAPDAVYYAQEDADTVEIWYARAAFRAQLTDAIDVTLSYTQQSDEIGGRRQVTRGLSGFGRRYDDYENGSIQLEPSSRDVRLAALEATVDLGFATLTSSTSYYEHEGESVSENTGYYAQNGWLSFYYNYPRPMASAVRSYADKALIQEIRLVSDSDGPMDYVVGAFYQRQRLRATQESYLRGFARWWDLAFPTIPNEVNIDQDFAYDRREEFVDKAVFGELTWHFTEDFEATVGGRWFANESDNRTFMDVPVYASFSAPVNIRFAAEDSKALFKLNASWRFAERQRAYATVAQGYRRGGANAVPLTGRYREDARWQTYGPDEAINYEVGVKGSTPAFTYTAALFYIDWKDIQLNTVTPNWGFFVVQNGGRARSQGLEAQLDGRAAGFRYSLGYTLTDAKLTEDVFAPTGGATPVAREGARLPGTPRHAITVALEKSVELANGSTLTGRINGYYQSETRNAVTTSTRLNVPLEGFQLWNASGSWENGPWRASLFVKNIFNEEGVTGRFTEAYMGTLPSAGYFGSGAKDLITLPRTVGLALERSF